jgi:hypothetical protein
MDTEKLIYEAKPFVCIGAAVYALLTPRPAPYVFVLSFILIGCGAFILDMRVQARKKRTSAINTLFYTAQPFLYIGLAIWAIVTQSTSKLAVACAAILFVCAAVILKWRTD